MRKQGKSRIMSEKKVALSVQAVITEADDEFVVSVTLRSPGEAPAIVGEEFVPTIEAAESYIEQCSSNMGYSPKKVNKLYVLADGKIRTRLTRPKKKG